LVRNCADRPPAASALLATPANIGTSLVCDFPSRAQLDAWLEVEPYVTGKVWQTIEVHRCKSGSAFAKKAAI
jgi:hypothetical protein